MSNESLKSLAIQNLRGCVEPFTLDFEKGKKLTIVYGENGSGKSTICDALEFVGRGKVGSLDDRGLGQTQRYWPSVGKHKNDISVSLATHGDKYNATQNGNTTVWNPTDKKPVIEILRRSQILKLVEAEPAKRYNEIGRFVNVSSVQGSEDSLEKLIKAVRREWDEQISRLHGSEDALKKLFAAAGRTGGNPVEWAKQEANRDFSDNDQEAKQLTEVERAFQILATHKGVWSAAQEKLTLVQDRLRESQEKVDASLADVAEGAGDVIDILTAAKPFLSKTPNPSSCPLCESKENIAGLGDRVAARIDAFRTLKDAKDNLAAAMKSWEIAAPEPERLKEKYAKDRDAFQKSIGGKWSKDIELPATNSPLDLSEFDVWYENNKTLPDKWRGLSAKRAEEKNASTKIKEVLSAYEENRELPTDVEALIPRLTKALELMREERHSFTDGILSKIAGEVGRLYEVVHPGEGLQKISLQLDPNQRASLKLHSEFCGKVEVPPQAYFSESHLDTLGLCVFLALAKMENPSGTILVIDDVLASVDEPHVERLIETICDEAMSFRHCVITTHYRPWREKYRWGWLKNGKCQFIELGNWTEKAGLSQTRTVPELKRLESLLSETSPDVQSICSKSGVILEATLDFLTQLYECKVPRRSMGRYTLGELLPSINKKLRAALRVEVQTGNAEGVVKYDERPLGQILDELERIAQTRNVFGAHFNNLSFEMLDTDAIGFSNKVLELSKLLTDEENGWPRNNKSGNYWATTGETRRLYPLIQPK